MADHRRRFHPRMGSRAGTAGAGPGRTNGNAAAAHGAHGALALAPAPAPATAPAPALAPTSSAAAAPLAQPSALTSASVRRSLFQSQLTRRAPQGSGATAAATARSTTHVAAFGLDGSDRSAHRSTSPSPPIASGSPLSLLERDRDGELQLLDPPSPSPDELRDMVLDELEESARERQRLSDAIAYHRQRSSIADETEDLLDAVRASMRSKVSALAEDDWMYEAGLRLG